jgi:hypothetical protein
MSNKTQMTTAAAARIQATGAKAGNGQTAKGSFEARAQSAAAKNSNQAKGK